MKKLVLEYGSEFDWASNQRFITDRQINYSDSTESSSYYLRSGRDAFKAVAMLNRETHNKVLLPALCCNSMVMPFRIYDYSIEYYSINNNFTANYHELFNKLDEKTIFVYMNYFGNISLKTGQLTRLKKQFSNTLFIEDNTHDILKSKSEGFMPDFSICSIRKWFALPDGGILTANHQTLKNMINFEVDQFFSSIREEALKLKSEYLVSGDRNIKDVFLKKFRKSNAYLDADTSIRTMSKSSADILKKLKIEDMFNIRIKNCVALNSLIMKSIIGRLETAPSLYFPVIIHKRDYVQKKLADLGIYCPVIWPIPNEARKLCSFSDYISDHILALPCDHRYTQDDMHYISAKFLAIINGEIK